MTCRGEQRGAGAAVTTDSTLSAPSFWNRPAATVRADPRWLFPSPLAAGATWDNKREYPSPVQSSTAQHNAAQHSTTLRAHWTSGQLIRQTFAALDRTFAQTVRVRQSALHVPSPAVAIDDVRPFIWQKRIISQFALAISLYVSRSTGPRKCLALASSLGIGPATATATSDGIS